MSIDWSKIYKKYKGLWVALKDDETTVVGSGKTAKQALEMARTKGFENPILHQVPTKVMPFINFFQR